MHAAFVLTTIKRGAIPVHLLEDPFIMKNLIRSLPTAPKAKHLTCVPKLHFRMTSRLLGYAVENPAYPDIMVLGDRRNCLSLTLQNPTLFLFNSPVAKLYLPMCVLG